MRLRQIGGVLSLFILAGALTAARDELRICKCKPRDIGDSGSRKDWDGFRKDIKWHYSVDEALKIAQAEGKMIFWYHVVGDLDKEGC